MLQTLYISTAREPITPAMCDRILQVSRRNNRSAGVTGLLVAGKRRFLQALEGPEVAVRATYQRIAADQRHFACIVLSERHVDVRAFGDWAMGYTTAGDDEVAGDDLRATVAALTSAIEDRSLRAQFTGFADIQSRAA